MTLPIVLGSSSQSRKQVLEKHMPFTTISPNIDEKAIRDEDPKKLTLLIAHAKMKAVENKCPNSIVICMDQVVMVNNIILEKPESKEEARKFINLYNSYPAVCITGLVMKNTLTGQTKSCNVVETQEFSKNVKIPASIVEALIEDGECMWCAGALIVEHPLIQPYIIKSEYEEAIRGLPIREVTQFIKELQK